MYCTKCGHKNPDEAKFCAYCGAQLLSDDTTVTLQPPEADLDLDADLSNVLDELAPGQALLVVKRGPNVGSRFVLDKDVISAGRSPDSDIFLNDVTVSRRHIELHREGGRYLAKDAGSLNGSYINRERVEVAELNSGDELQIGKFKLVFFEKPNG